MTASTNAEPKEVEKKLLKTFFEEDLVEKLLMKELHSSSCSLLTTFNASELHPLPRLRAENPQDCEEVDTTEVDEEMTPTEEDSQQYEANESPLTESHLTQVPSRYQGAPTDWLEVGLYACTLACEYEGVRATLKTIRSMCYLLKKQDDLPDWIFMSERRIRSLAKVSKNFRLCEQDHETEILFVVKPPSYVREIDECSESDLLGACLKALPVRCSKRGDWCLGLAGALREELVKKPRLCEIRRVIETLLESEQASVHGCGRWRLELAKMEESSEPTLVVLLAAGATLMQPAAASAETNDELIALLRQDRELLDPLPKMLKDQKWDNVRSVLKTPPVSYLWNLGLEKNTLKKLGDNLGEIQVLELMDEIASCPCSIILFLSLHLSLSLSLSFCMSVASDMVD
ncbi:Ift52 [Symbiodinium sp. CCMP2592]|nr:Ift52 [Symbiodinium sp. CCMP2592]